MQRLHKILALAQRGERGEKDAAEAHLATLLKKHGMTLEDLIGEEPAELRELNFGDATGRRLMIQIVGKVTGEQRVRYQQRKGARSVAFFKLTKPQLVEVEFLFAIMRAALAKEIELLTNAFIHKNKLYAPANPDDSDDRPAPTPEELAEIKRMAALMQHLTPVAVHKAIGTDQR
jgi:hypothetical protein